MGWLNPDCLNGFEFPPRGTGLHGLGETVWAPGAVFFQWTLMDEVEVPANLVPGEYVLSFRYRNRYRNENSQQQYIFASYYLNTQNMTNPTIVSPVKMEYG